MKLDVVFPTYQRLEKSVACLNSILKQSYDQDLIDIYIYFSDSHDYHSFPSDLASKIFKKFIEPEHFSAPYLWNSHIKNYFAYDALCYLTDDIELEPDCIQKAVDCMNLKFPDLDGVVGLNQYNLNTSTDCEAAFGLIGKKFMDRFPNRQVFCPRYKRFYIDSELCEFAKLKQKFFHCKDARLMHKHPVLSPKWHDSTHVYVRKEIGFDQSMNRSRKARHLLWGENFE